MKRWLWQHIWQPSVASKWMVTAILKGLLTYVPGLYDLLVKPRGRGGTDAAEYCYGIWLKHLTLLWDYGLSRMPDTVAEFGPGASIGVGLAALLSGVRQYHAVDVVAYADPAKNLAMLDALIPLFTQRARRPVKGWPDFDRSLDAQLFPIHILTEPILEAALRPERIERIRQAILQPNSAPDQISIRYFAPWNDPNIIQPESVDLILSHAVLEHIANLDMSYRTFSLWLKPQGLMSHQIDFTSHRSAAQWNGHWAHAEWMWQIMVGKRPYLINRQPYSTHRRLLEQYGFKLLCNLKQHRSDGIRSTQLAPRWRNLAEEDLTTAGAFLIAQKMAKRA